MKRRSGFGWLELVTGLLLIALGILIFVKPGFALSGLVFLYGLAAVVMGIADIVLYIHVERFLGFAPTLSLISGILSVMTGVMLAAYPEAGAVGFNRGINDEQAEQHSRENSIEPSTERPRRSAGKTPENGP